MTRILLLVHLLYIIASVPFFSTERLGQCGGASRHAFFFWRSAGYKLLFGHRLSLVLGRGQKWDPLGEICQVLWLRRNLRKLQASLHTGQKLDTLGRKNYVLLLRHEVLKMFFMIASGLCSEVVEIFWAIFDYHNIFLSTLIFSLLTSCFHRFSFRHTFSKEHFL